MMPLPKRSDATLLVGLIFIASGALGSPALAQAVDKSTAAAANAETDDGGKSLREIWTCSMHPQVRQPKAGKCPFCGMDQIPAREMATSDVSTLMSLQQMLARGLKYNAEVRAAQARIQAAEADLDRTRFDVLRQITAFRTKWDNQRAALQNAFREMQGAEAALRGGDSAAANQLAASAREKYFLLRAKLAEVEAELPFLLGQGPHQVARPVGSESRQLIRDQLLPLARQTLELRAREYQAGEASILDVAATHRQIAELEARLAETDARKIAVVQSQKELLQSVREIAVQRYRTGSASQGDVLSLDLELSKLDLQLLDLKGK